MSYLLISCIDVYSKDKTAQATYPIQDDYMLKIEGHVEVTITPPVELLVT